MVDAHLIDEMITDVKNTRRIIKKYEALGNPQFERYIRGIDMSLHNLLWCTGEAVQYRPDLPIEN